MNCMVSDGTDFYLSSGFYQEPNNPARLNRRDLWKFDSATRTWSELPPPPDAMYAPVMTYDSHRHALVSWVHDKLYVYNITERRWTDETPPGLPCVSNQTGVYAPTARVHVFEGGNDCPGVGGTYMVVGVGLNG